MALSRRKAQYQLRPCIPGNRISPYFASLVATIQRKNSADNSLQEMPFALGLE